MNKGNLVKYRKKVCNDLVTIDDAISDDIVLSREEWFDFLFKSALMGYRSWNIKKYRTFNKEICKFVEVYAEVLSHLIEFSIDGFTNSSYIKVTKRIVSLMNKFTSYRKYLRAEGYDKNGTMYIDIYKGNKKVISYPVKGKQDGIERVKCVSRYCIDNIDSFSHNGEFGNFIKGYLGQEFDTIINNIEPYPYVCEDGSHTLYERLNDFTEEEDFEDMGSKIIAIG